MAFGHWDTPPAGGAPLTSTLALMDSSIIDPVLGTLKLDQRFNWYEGHFDTEDYGAVAFSISVGVSADVETVIRAARSVIPVIVGSLAQAKVVACDCLLSLKNEGWLEDNEAPLSQDEFISRLSVESIGFHVDRECEVFFTDGDIFWGHTILLFWNHSQGFHNADIEG